MNTDEFNSGRLRMRRTVVKALVLLTTVVLPLTFADWVVGCIYPKVVPELSRRNLAVLMGEMDARTAFNERPHPYLVWENMPGYMSPEGVRQVNNQGYRNERDFPEKFEEGTVRVLCLGGSTTYGYLLGGPTDAWPAQLERWLRERFPGKKVEVVNGGLLYGTSAELLAHYMFRDRYLEGVGIVVLHVGGNDIYPLLIPGYDPEYTHFRGAAGSTISLRRGERWLLARSNILQLIYARWLNQGLATAVPMVAKELIPWDTISAAEAMENVRRNEPVGFRRNLDLLLRNIKADGKIPVLMSFIMAPDSIFTDPRYATAAAKADFLRHVQEAMRTGLEKVKCVMAELAKAHGARYIDVPEGTIPAECFLDSCHLNEAGEAVKARVLGEVLLPILEK